MVEIKWKPEELPINTVIEDKHHGRLVKTAGFVLKDDGTRSDPIWDEIGYDDCQYYKDSDITDYEILAIPPAWYDEWKIFSRNMPQYKINRRGDVRHTSHIEAAKRPSSVTEEMVRRAFSNNPL